VSAFILTKTMRKEEAMKQNQKYKQSHVGVIFGALALVGLTLGAGGTGWVNRAAIPTALQQAGVAEIDGTIYVTGGGSGTNGLATLYAYSPATNTWSTLASMPSGVYIPEAAGLNGQLYVAGGWTGFLPVNSLYRYDPPSNTWTTLASLPQLSACGAAGAINGMLYVTSPEDGFNGVFNIFDVYDPASNTWTALPGSSDVHDCPAYGVIDGKLYLATGTNLSGPTPQPRCTIQPPTLGLCWLPYQPR
jgi:N-acetylneuraminic acid mutarotase